MSASLRFAVVLAGCGNKDGAEIHEAVLTLLAIDQTGHSYQCFAPNIPYKRVLNYLTNETVLESRNVLLEAARIARSNIKPLETFDARDYDILVLVGGSGVAHNLCTFANDGQTMTINTSLAHAVTQMHDANKPIGALCIAPVIVAKLIPTCCVTFGSDEKVNGIAHQWSATTQNTKATEIVTDAKHKIVTTPCYMIANARISDLALGIKRLIESLIQLV